MADNTFQNQAYYVPDPDEAMKFDFGTNNMVDESFSASSNQAWLDSIAWDTSLDGQMTLNNVVQDATMNDTHDSVWPGPVVGESYLNEPTKFNAAGDDTLHDPGHITFDSYIDGPLTVNLATNTIRDDIFDIAYMTCDPHLGEPTKEFQKWKESWDEKMLLVSWKREGKDWKDIYNAFQKMGIQKCSSGWKSTLQRTYSEVEALGKAIIADREGEAERLRGLALCYPLGDAVQADYDGLWARIAESIQTYGGERKWSSDKLKYAWNHGASGLLPHIQLRQRKVLNALLL